MFIIGFALIAGSVIYYLWAVERIADKVDSGDELLPVLRTQGRDDFHNRPGQFSAKEHPQQTVKDNGTDDDLSSSDLK